MADGKSAGLDEALATAQETIARQAAEIEQLRRRLAEESFAEELRDALSVAGIAGAVGAPVGHAQLLRLILETAAEVMSAESAVLLLLDREGDELVFDVTLGLDVDEVEGLRIPLGQGIAGLVAASGQAMALSDAEGDPRVGDEIVQALSFTPRSVLCVPLAHGERLIGVLEVFDKDGGNAFTTRDIEILSLFAKQAAVTIVQSRLHRSIELLLAEVLGPDSPPDLRERAVGFAKDVEANGTYGYARELAEQLLELSTHGEAEMAAGLALVREFAAFVRTRPALGGVGEAG